MVSAPGQKPFGPRRRGPDGGGHSLPGVKTKAGIPTSWRLGVSAAARAEFRAFSSVTVVMPIVDRQESVIWKASDVTLSWEVKKPSASACRSLAVLARH